MSEKLATRRIRRAAVAVCAGGAALLVTACGAGQISQTADQVSAVNGAFGHTEDNTVGVRDVTVVLGEGTDAAVKFTAVNQDSSLKKHTLKSIKVDGAEVTLSPTSAAIEPNCSLRGGSAEEMKGFVKTDGVCITPMTTSLENTGFAAGGTMKVEFTFDTGKAEVNAAVSGEQLPAGEESAAGAEAHGDSHAHEGK